MAKRVSEYVNSGVICVETGVTATPFMMPSIESPFLSTQSEPASDILRLNFDAIAPQTEGAPGSLLPISKT